MTSRFAAVAAASALAVSLAASCASATADPSAPYFPKNRPTAAAPAPVDPNADLPAVNLVAGGGPVARPNPQLTPGAVALTDVATVCAQPKRVRAPVAIAVQQAIFAEYGIPATETHRYGMDYLVPLQIGGSTDSANLWPAATRGVGFHAKQQLNARLRTRVCRGEVALAQAQHDVAADWYSAWLRYGS